MTDTKIQEVVAVIDRSGSMMGKEDDTLGGINSTFEVLKQEKDENTNIKVSVKLFDHEQTMLFTSIDLEKVRNITRDQYYPRGQTSLLDAIGDTLSHFMEKKLMHPNAYDSCVVYIVTDGLENNSRNYTYDKIKKLVEEAETVYNIKILYLGANQDAIQEASKYGINANQAMNYSETTNTVNAAYRACASVTRRVSTSGDASFLQAERTASACKPRRSTTMPPRVTRQNNDLEKTQPFEFVLPSRQRSFRQ